MQIKGMVFDMDGTLLNTEQQYIEGWLKSAERCGYDLPVEKVLSAMGLPRAVTRKMYEEYFGEGFDFDKMKDYKEEWVDSLWEKNGIPIKPYVKELLEYCRENNIRCAVATSTLRSRATDMLNKVGIAEYFDAIVGGDDIENGKPNPDIFIEASRQIGVPTELCAGVEDSRSGITAVKRANMQAFFVEDMLKPDEEIYSIAHYVCKNLKEVMEYIK